MSTVSVTIAGRSYRIACGDGEEGHLTNLAAMLDAKIEEMRGAFGEIGDMRLHVMAALAIADELAETRRKLGALEESFSALDLEAKDRSEDLQKVEEISVTAISHAADRIEKLAKILARGGQGEQAH